MAEKTDSDFHNVEVRLNTTFNKFMEYTSADNVQMLKKYAETLKNSRNRGIKNGKDQHIQKVKSKNTISTRLVNLYPLCMAMDNKSFNDIELSDIEKAVKIIDDRLVKDGTKNSYRIAMRLFLLYMGKDELANQINTTIARNRKLPEDLLSLEDIEKMIRVAHQTRDKAIISVLYETGARIGEIMQMKFKDVSFDESGAILVLQNSKTTPRRIRIVWSVAMLRQWTLAHPTKTGNDPLWPRLDQTGKGLDYQGAWGVIRRVWKKSGVTKRVHPHIFRHSRATHLAHHLTEQEMKVYLGWQPDSGMAGIYVHMTGQDVDPAIMRMYGIDQGPVPTDILKPRKCPKCGEYQDAKAAYCMRCGYAMTKEAADTVDTAKDALLKLIMENPDIMAAIRGLQT
jgi:site-specific recombinase XerD